MVFSSLSENQQYAVIGAVMVISQRDAGVPLTQEQALTVIENLDRDLETAKDLFYRIKSIGPHQLRELVLEAMGEEWKGPEEALLVKTGTHSRPTKFDHWAVYSELGFKRVRDLPMPDLTASLTCDIMGLPTLGYKYDTHDVIWVLAPSGWEAYRNNQEKMREWRKRLS